MMRNDIRMAESAGVEPASRLRESLSLANLRDAVPPTFREMVPLSGFEPELRRI